jgi:hypothetical protein
MQSGREGRKRNGNLESRPAMSSEADGGLVITRREAVSPGVTGMYHGEITGILEDSVIITFTNVFYASGWAAATGMTLSTELDEPVRSLTAPVTVHVSVPHRELRRPGGTR